MGHDSGEAGAEQVSPLVVDEAFIAAGQAALQVLEARGECLIVCTADRRIVAANTVADDLFRAGRGELVGRCLEDLMSEQLRGRHAEYVEGFASSTADTMEMGSRLRPIVARRLTGVEFTVLARIHRVPRSTPALLCVSMIELSDEGALQRELSGHSSVAGVITQQMAIGVVLQSSTGSIIEANAAAEQILGLTRDQMMGRTSIDPRWRSVRADGTAFPGHIHPSMRAIRDGGVQRDLMGVHKPDGTMTWIDIEARRLVETADSAVFASFVDVTAVRDSESRLTAALQRQDVLTLLSSEAVLTVDASFTVTSASGTAGRLLGFGEAAVIGQRLPSWSADEGHWRSIERALGELLAYPGARGRWDFVLKLGTGHTRTFECSGMNMFADPGIRGIVLNLRDIHDQRMAEAAVRAANEQLERQVHEMKADRAFDASLGRVAELLQHCSTINEAQDVLWASLPNLLPGFRLGLYFASEGQTDFFRHRPGPGDSAFLMIDGCWALRTRRTHISDQGVIMRCDHAAGEAGPMACLPLVLGGLPLGLISMRTELGGPPLPPRDDLERLAVRLSMVAGNSPLRGEPPPT